jgi:hypothetical protein
MGGISASLQPGRPTTSSAALRRVSCSSSSGVLEPTRSRRFCGGALGRRAYPAALRLRTDIGL